MKIIKNLNKICKMLDENFNINHGGCCYLAYLIASILDKYHIKYKVAIQGECAIESADDIKNKLCGKDCSNCCWVNGYHILLKVKNEYINKLDGKHILHIKNMTTNDILNFYVNNKWKNGYDMNNNDKVKEFLLNYLEKDENERIF